MLDTNGAPPQVAGDPASRALQLMAQQGALPDHAPAAQAAPAGFVQTLMHNLVTNSTAFKDSALPIRALAAAADLLNSPHAAVQAALGVTPESQRAFAERVAPAVPAPSWMQLLNPAMGAQQFAQQLIGQGDSGRRWSPETINMGLDLAGDPTSYLGVGLFKNLGKAAVTKGAPRAVVKGLEVAAKGDEAYSDAMGAVAEKMIGLVQSGLVPVNKALAKQWPELVKWTEYYETERTMGRALQWLENKGWDLPSLRALTTQQATPLAPVTVGKGAARTQVVAGQSDITPVLDELPTALRAQINPDHLQMIIEGAPPSASGRAAKGLRSPTDDMGAALDNYRTFLRRDMGLDDPNKFASWYSAFNDWWKGQALGSLNYLAQNLQGGAAFGQMVGVDASKTLAEAADHAPDILAGRQFHATGASDLANKVGVPIPYDLHEQADNALASRIGTSTNNPLRDSIAYGILGGIGAGPMGAIAGAAIGSRVGAISDRIRKSGQAIETVLRERGWEEGMSRALVESMGEMEKAVVDGLTTPGARASGRPVNQAFIDNLAQKIQAQGGQVSTGEIRRELINSVRITQDRADEITKQLDDILYNASQKGTALSNKFNFDYQDLSAFERVLSNAFPFSTWTLKATPFFAEQAARHPLVGNIVRTEKLNSAQTQQERGLGPRFSGTLPSSTGSSILSAILGRPVQFFNDPLQGFMPFAGAAQALNSQQFEGEDQQTNPIQKLYDTLDTLGMSPSPIADLILRNSGLIGEPDDPAKGVYLRAAAPVAGASALANRAVEAATGQPNTVPYIDINRGSQKIEEAVRKVLTGREVTNVLDVQTERRVDELALKNTGNPIGSDDPSVAQYVRARATHSGPIWERARAEVELEKGVQALTGFVDKSVQPQAILTGEEAQIREAKKDSLVDAGVARDLRTQAARNPAAMADPKAVAAVQSANDAILQVTGFDAPPPDIAERLANPTNANLEYVSKQIYLWEVEQRPLLQGYGASGSPEQRRLGNETAAMAVAGRGLDPLQQALMIQQNRASQLAQGKMPDTFVAAKAIPGQMRSAIEESDPLLKEYLAWRPANPGMGVPEFLAQKYGK